MTKPMIKNNRIIFLFIFLIAVLAGCRDGALQTETHPFPQADSQNIDGEQLVRAFNNAETIDALQGLAVARNNVLVAERYYHNANPEADPNIHVMSVTKSISATLVGIAIDKGFIQSVEQTVSDFLGAEVDTVNPALGQVTIHQLLTMTCGHDWHEIGSESEFMDFFTAPDQLNYILNKPIVNPPGTVFNYSDGAAHLISVILSKATGMDASAFANQYLFGPMGLGERIWYKDKRLFAYGGVGLCIGNLDMIKIGFLYLNQGYFNGKQIVPSAWIQRATGFQMATHYIIPFLTDYGYYWWLGNAHGHDFICANGYGGQFIFIVKDLNLVVSSRTDYRGITRAKANENWYNVLTIIINQILPAVREM
ncbi:MAG: class C beta-lactamase-related serine hydrolase [Calditrichales bacterium]|nr:MAG: class C beta-lactamase-related serine hydrolase [Calditrichales bacterium]